jgi:hypothetical protein
MGFTAVILSITLIMLKRSVSDESLDRDRFHE